MMFKFRLSNLSLESTRLLYTGLRVFGTHIHTHHFIIDLLNANMHNITIIFELCWKFSVCVSLNVYRKHALRGRKNIHTHTHTRSKESLTRRHISFHILAEKLIWHRSRFYLLNWFMCVYTFETVLCGLMLRTLIFFFPSPPHLHQNHTNSRFPRR